MGARIKRVSKKKEKIPSTPTCTNWFSSLPGIILANDFSGPLQVVPWLARHAASRAVDAIAVDEAMFRRRIWVAVTCIVNNNDTLRHESKNHHDHETWHCPKKKKIHKKIAQVNLSTSFLQLLYLLPFRLALEAKRLVNIFFLVGEEWIKPQEKSNLTNETSSSKSM